MIMNATQLRNLSKKQLIEKLQELRKQLIELRAKKGVNQNNMQIRNTRRDIARILTLLKENSFKQSYENKEEKKENKVNKEVNKEKNHENEQKNDKKENKKTNENKEVKKE